MVLSVKKSNSTKSSEVLNKELQARAESLYTEVIRMHPPKDVCVDSMQKDQKGTLKVGNMKVGWRMRSFYDSIHYSI